MTTRSFIDRHRDKAFPVVAGFALLIAALVFRAELAAWFGGGDEGEPSATSAHDHSGAGTGGDATSGGAAASLTYEFSPPALDSMLRGLAAYEQTRIALAADQAEGVADHARTIAKALRDVRAADIGAPAEIAEHLASAAKAADALAGAPQLEGARAAFASLSEQIIPLVAADSRLSDSSHVFACPMTKGFNKWVQPSEQLSNPYMGTQMLTCGSEVDWSTTAGGAEAPAHVHDPNEIAYYTCPMDTWVKQTKPGKCPVCGMDLVPVTKEQVRTGELRIDHRRRQLIGLRIGEVERRNVTLKIRAIGKVVYDESRLADVTIKYKGWIEKLHVDTTGELVRKGQKLFTLYSPELYAAQQEYLLALRQKTAARDDAGRTRAEALVRGARERLRLWDISDKQLRELAETGEPRQYIPIYSPASGYVVEKNVVEGAAVQAGERLFRVAGLDKVWVEADVYEQDIPLVKKGMAATISLSHVPGQSYPGTVSFVYPYMDKMSRTSRVRIVLPNRDLALKPDMYANVDFAVELGERLMVPEPAILYSGPRRIVFLDLGNDVLRPQVIEVGVRSDSYYEVLSGLKEGDHVVTSGNFLLSSESRLKSATGLW